VKRGSVDFVLLQRGGGGGGGGNLDTVFLCETNRPRSMIVLSSRFGVTLGRTDGNMFQEFTKRGSTKFALFEASTGGGGHARGSGGPDENERMNFKGGGGGGGVWIVGQKIDYYGLTRGRGQRD